MEQRLTGRQLEVALLVAQGATNREAARALGLSARTVGAHLERIYRELGVHRRIQLANLLAASRAVGRDVPGAPG